MGFIIPPESVTLLAIPNAVRLNGDKRVYDADQTSWSPSGEPGYNNKTFPCVIFHYPCLRSFAWKNEDMLGRGG